MKLFGKTLPAVAGPLAPRVASELQQAETRLATLRQRHAELALAVALGEADADATMHNWRADLAAAEAEAGDLRAAHQAALAKDAEAERSRRLAAQAGRVNALRQHCSAREKATLRLAAAIENAVSAYEDVLGVNRKLFSLLNDAKHLPVETLAPPAAFRGAVAAELLRVGHGPQGDGATFPIRFPGGAAPDFDHQHRPEAITPLAERVKAGSAMLLGLLGAGTAPAPATPGQAAEPVPATDVAASAGAAEPDPAAASPDPFVEGADDLAPDDFAAASLAATLAKGETHSSAELIAALPRLRTRLR